MYLMGRKSSGVYAAHQVGPGKKFWTNSSSDCCLELESNIVRLRLNNKLLLHIPLIHLLLIHLFTADA